MKKSILLVSILSIMFISCDDVKRDKGDFVKVTLTENEIRSLTALQETTDPIPGNRRHGLNDGCKRKPGWPGVRKNGLNK